MNEEFDLKYDLFISYTEADEAWVNGYLLDALKAADVTYHTEQAFELGQPRLLAFEEAIKQSKRILLVLSPAYLLDEANRFIDLMVQQYGLETGTWPVIPLVLKPVTMPMRLGMLTRIEATDEQDWASAIKRLAEALSRPEPAPTAIPLPPYPGMRAFSEDDRNHFYGREEMVEDLIRQLWKQSFLALIGPSGSGKSSLVYAGMVPALRDSPIFGEGTWLVGDMRPGEEPLKALQTLLAGDLGQLETSVTNLLATQVEAQRFLLIVDQFEELFTVAERQVDDFQAVLKELAALPEVYIILTIRADFYAPLMSTALWSEIQQYRYEVLPLDDRGLAQAIINPAETVDVYVEPTLVERLVADAGQQPGLLPFLQETMILLWAKIERRYLPLSAYETLVLPRTAYESQNGARPRTGLQVAIALHAEGIWGRLTDEQKLLARRIFVRLVQFGEGRDDTRRQQPESELYAENDSSSDFQHVLAYLIEHRLLTSSNNDKSKEAFVDLAHEKLIDAWPRFNDWLETYQSMEETRRSLVLAATVWQTNNQDSIVLTRLRRKEKKRDA